MLPDSTARQPRRSSISHAASECRASLRAVIDSVAPSEHDAWLTRAQFELYWGSTRHTALLLPLAAYFVAQAVSPWVALQTRTLWWTTVSLLGIATNLLGRWIDRRSGDDIAGLRFRARWFVLLNVVFFTAWCSMGAVLWVSGLPLNHMMLVLILACSLAGSIAITAVHPAIGLCVLIVHAVFLIAPTAASGTRLDTTLAELSGIYVALMTGQLVGLNVSTTKMLSLEHERSRLVADLRLAKAESDRARARAATAGQAKSQFLAHMNHELRTPMNAILGFSEMIERKAFGEAIDKYAEYAGIIHESGQTLLSLINDVLDLAKIQGGRLSLRESEIDLRRIGREAVEKVETAAANARLSISASVASGVPIVRADERAIRQMLANLLSNAIKFTPTGGEVRVFARCDPDGRVAFGVEDTGIGMAPEEQPHVFERFGQGRHDVTTAERGTGLGLAIVKGFAEAHDGEVALESELGTGTRVTVYLPRERVAMPAPLKAIA